MTPLVVETPGGLSVSYGGRSLYSSRDPARTPERAAREADIPPETLVVCASPLLGYGLDTLLARLPSGSAVLAVERDEALMALSLSRAPRETLEHPRLRYYRSESIPAILSLIPRMPGFPFRRVRLVSLSGGADLHRDFYAELAALAGDLLSRHWRNRLTLIRFGRGYARNLFRNLARLPDSTPLPLASVGKPILVAGSGPSLERALSEIARHRERLFVLACDTALPVLAASGIRPDAVAVVESQFWIERAFHGLALSRIPVFADLTARPRAIARLGGPVSYFLSAYADARYLDRLANAGLAPHAIPPLGSVGLAAVRLALDIAVPGEPVLCVGLDFSHPIESTHARGAPACVEREIAAARLAPIGFADSSFAEGSSPARGKDGREVRTDPTLSGYRDLFEAEFSRVGGLFDCGETGLPLGIPRARISEVLARQAAGRSALYAAQGAAQSAAECPSREAIDRFISEERERLIALRAALTGERAAGIDEVRAELVELDYLHLHFPDSHRASEATGDFLNRARAEVEWFLKTLTLLSS